METTAFLVLAFVLGLRHSLDPDHVAAVTAFVSREPGARRGAMLGLRWAAGHGLTLLLLGSAVILLGLRFSESFEVGADRVVGVLIMGLAVWRLWTALRGDYHLHVHSHSEDDVKHAHAHSHYETSGHSHQHAVTAMGVLHGVAGTAGVFVLLPISVVTPIGLAYSYLGLFILGTFLSMGVWGLASGSFFSRIEASRAGKLFTGVVITASLMSFAVGAMLFQGLL